MKQLAPILLSLLIMQSLTGCDKGLEPPKGKPVISGRVRFLSPWPKKDSTGQLVLALMTVPPPYTDSQLLAGLFKTVLPVVESFNYGITDSSFTYTAKPGQYYYMGVAQLIVGDSTIFRVVGFAHDALDSAIVFDLKEGEKIDNVSIDVRFDSLPRQPFVE